MEYKAISVTELNSYINSEEEAFVIGGEEIYRILMPYCKKIRFKDIRGWCAGIWRRIEWKKSMFFW